MQCYLVMQRVLFEDACGAGIRPRSGAAEYLWAVAAVMGVG